MASVNCLGVAVINSVISANKLKRRRKRTHNRVVLPVVYWTVMEHA